MRPPRPRPEVPVRISARADYAIRAAVELAAQDGDGLMKGEQIARAQDIPLKFLLNILRELKQARIVRSHRGSDGGFALERDSSEITVAEVILAVDGSLARVHEDGDGDGTTRALRDVWLRVEAVIDETLAKVTLADLVAARR